MDSLSFSTSTAKLGAFWCCSLGSTLALCLLCLGDFLFLSLLFILGLLYSFFDFTTLSRYMSIELKMATGIVRYSDHKKVLMNKISNRTHRRAASLAASLTSGFSVLFFWITSKVAPTIDLE